MTTLINTVRRAEVYIKAYQGDTFCPTLTFTDENGDPLDFTGVEFKMQIRNKSGQLEKTLLMDQDIFVTLPNIVAFNTLVNIDKGVYDTDLQGKYTDGKVVTFIGGQFEVFKEITQ